MTDASTATTAFPDKLVYEAKWRNAELGRELADIERRLLCVIADDDDVEDVLNDILVDLVQIRDDFHDLAQKLFCLS